MPKSIPTPGQIEWATPLNSHLSQISNPETGGINILPIANPTEKDEGHTYVDIPKNELKRLNPDGVYEAILSGNNTNYNSISKASSTSGVHDHLEFVDSIYDLITSINPNLHGEIYVKGYHYPNDGGGGLFHYNSNIPRSQHNGGTIISPDHITRAQANLDTVASFPANWTNTTKQELWLSEQPNNNNTGVWERIFKNGDVNVKWFGAVDDGIIDASVSIQKTIDYCRTNRENFNAVGDIFLTRNPIIIDKQTGNNLPGQLYWAGNTTNRPISYQFKCTIFYTGNNSAFIIGSDSLGDDVYIENIIGTGITNLGARHSNNEKIGVTINAIRSNIEIGTITDFNIGICCNGVFSNLIKVKVIMACYYGFYSRFDLENGASNQSNNFEFVHIGGVFASPAFPNDALRRSRSCHIGIYIEDGTSLRIIGGAVQYCQFNSDSVALYISKAAHDNHIYAYVEGAREDGKLVVCEGNNNTLELTELASPTIEKDSIIISGLNNKFSGLDGRLSSSAQGQYVPPSAPGIMDIDASTVFTGASQIQNISSKSVFKHNLLHGLYLGTNIPGAVTNSSSIPDNLPKNTNSHLYTLDSNKVLINTTGQIDISGRSSDLNKIKFLSFVKGIDKQVKITFFIINAEPGTSISSIENSISPTITANNHDFKDSDTVIISQCQGLTGLNNQSFVITNVTQNTFQLKRANTANMAVYTGGGVVKLCVEGMTASVSQNTDWQRVEFTRIIDSRISKIYFRVSGRNTNSSDGGSFLVANSILTFDDTALIGNVGGTNLEFTNPSPHWYHPAVMKIDFAQKYDYLSDNGTSIVSNNEININGKKIFVIDSISLPTQYIHSIKEMLNESSVYIINNSIYDVVFTQQAGEWKDPFILHVGTGIKIVKTNNKFYKIS